jgi:hypothetical protein
MEVFALHHSFDGIYSVMWEVEYTDEFGARWDTLDAKDQGAGSSRWRG